MHAPASQRQLVDPSLNRRLAGAVGLIKNLLSEGVAHARLQSSRLSEVGGGLVHGGSNGGFPRSSVDGIFKGEMNLSCQTPSSQTVAFTVECLHLLVINGCLPLKRLAPRN